MLNANRYIGFRYLKGNSPLISSTRFYSTSLRSQINEHVNNNNDINDNNDSNDNSRRYNRGGFNKQILQLNKQLSQRLNQSKNLSESYQIFNDLILYFESKYNKPNMVNNGQSVFNNTRYLNTTLTRLFKQSLSQAEPQVDPYQLLSDYCLHHLARPNHFFTLMKQYLIEKRYQDVLSLWVKYLDSLPTFRIDQFLYIHKGIQTYTIIAYLSLNSTQFTPDLKYLLTFLNIQDIDIVNLYERIKLSNFITGTSDNANQFIWTNFDSLLKQYLHLHSKAFQKRIKDSINVSELESMYRIYERYVAGDDTKPNVDILIAFIKRFISLDSAPLAMRVFDTFKERMVDPQEKLSLNNQLLYIVSRLGGGRNGTTKRQMIQAVWNTYFKMEYFQKPIPIESYCSLFESLTDAKEFKVLENIWDHELPANVKSDHIIKQCYLSCFLKDKKQEMTYENMVKRLEEESMVQYPKLIKVILLKIILDPKTKKEQYIEVWDKYKQVVENEIDSDFVAIDILSNYRYSTNKDDFNFMQALNNDKHSQHKPLVIESFITMVPTIHPIRKMYHQLKQYENDPSIIRMFIDAEFKKNSGDVNVADSIVKDYIFNATSELRDYTQLNLEEKLKIKLILDCIITNCSRNNAKEDIDMILKYITIANQWSITLQNSTIYQVIRRLKKLKVTKLPATMQQNVRDFLELITSKKIRFKLNDEDMKRFKQMELLQ